MIQRYKCTFASYASRYQFFNLVKTNRDFAEYTLAGINQYLTREELVNIPQAPQDK